MPMYLLDSNVVSELRKIRANRANENVARWSDSVDVSDLFVSSITIHEIELGILLKERKDPVQGSVLRNWMSAYVLPAFEQRILAVDKAVCLVSAKLHVPDPKPYRDTFIAATSLVHKMIVVTRNVADFNFPGVRVLNPWEFVV